jgi:hypothetical protein
MDNKNIRPEWVPSAYQNLKTEGVDAVKEDKEKPASDDKKSAENTGASQIHNNLKDNPPA